MRAAPDWLEPAEAYARVLWDPTGELPARVECGRSLRFLGELLFALEGIRAPYP